MSDQVAEVSATYLVEAARDAVPVGYKQTEVGVIPEDWSCIEIGALKPFITSGSRGWAAFYSAYGAPFVRITNTSRKSIYLDMTNTKFVSLSENASEGSRTSLENGDVLISITADIGICSYVDDQIEKPAYINQHIALVRFDTSIINSKFVAYFLSSHKVQKLFRSGSDQGAKAGMNLDGVRRIKLAIPTSSEQTTIANALSDVDALIDELEKLISKKQAIKTATMQQLLTGRTRLPQFSLREDGMPKGYKQSELGEIPEDWHAIALAEFTIKVGSGKTPSGGATVYVDSGRPFIRSQNVGWGSLDLTDVAFITDDIHRTFLGSELEADDVLLNITGASIGRCSKADTRIAGGNVNQHVCIIRVNKHQINPLILVELINSDFGQNQIDSYQAGGNREGLNFSQVRSLQFSISSNQQEQAAIATILSDMDEEILALEQRLGKTRQIKQGMMQELLTGKTRLVAPAA